MYETSDARSPDSVSAPSSASFEARSRFTPLFAMPCPRTRGRASPSRFPRTTAFVNPAPISIPATYRMIRPPEIGFECVVEAFEREQIRADRAAEVGVRADLERHHED